MGRPWPLQPLWFRRRCHDPEFMHFASELHVHVYDVHNIMFILDTAEIHCNTC